MEQIEQLLSKLREFNATELRLETGQKPYYITPAGAREISPTPIQHKDIVLLLSPVLPPNAKTDLMEKGSTDFSYTSPSGSFLVSVKKSNLGFNVAVSPADASAGAQNPEQAVPARGYRAGLREVLDGDQPG